MMDSLRNFLTGPRLFIVIAACALPFVFLGTSSLGATFQESLGTINGENVTQSDFQIASNQIIQKLKNTYGDDFDFNQLDEETQFNLIKQELIAQKVLLSESRKLGLLNKETINQTKTEIIKNTAFQVDGKFDEGVYEAQVNAIGYTKEEYISLMSDMIASDLFISAFTNNFFITENELLDIATIIEQTTNINFIKVDFSALKNQIINTEDEIKDYYNNNQLMFFTDEKRAFQYFTLEASDYESLVTVPDGYIDQEYNKYLQSDSLKNQIRFSHIMIEKSKYENNEEALKVANNVIVKLEEGADFIELVKTYSDDVVTKDNGGDLEYFDAEVFPELFTNALKELEINEFSDVVELDETLHILKITEITKPEIIPLEEIQQEFLSKLLLTESEALMNDDFSVVDEMIESNDSIQSIASYLSKDLKLTENLSQNNFNFEINDPRIEEAIFSPSISKDETLVIDLENKILVLSLFNIIEPNLIEFDIAATKANELLTEAKAFEKQNLLNNELDTSKNEGTIDEFIEAYDFISRESFVDVKRYSSLLPQEVLSNIFNSSSGSTIKVSGRNNDSYLIDIISFNDAFDTSEGSLDQYKDFGEKKISDNISSIINAELFESARVNLNNLIL